MAYTHASKLPRTEVADGGMATELATCRHALMSDAHTPHSCNYWRPHILFYSILKLQSRSPAADSAADLDLLEPCMRFLQSVDEFRPRDGWTPFFLVCVTVYYSYHMRACISNACMGMLKW